MLLELPSEVSRLLENVSSYSGAAQVLWALRDYVRSSTEATKRAQKTQEEEALFKRRNSTSEPKTSEAASLNGDNGNYKNEASRATKVLAGGLVIGGILLKSADATPSRPEPSQFENITTDDLGHRNRTSDNTPTALSLNFTSPNTTNEDLTTRPSFINATSFNSTSINITNNNLTTKPSFINTTKVYLSTSPCALSLPINISSLEDLEKIGVDPGFPLNGTYCQTCDINAQNLTSSIGMELPFTGRYDGFNHKISNSNTPLFTFLYMPAEVRNLEITNGLIVREKPNTPLGLLICDMFNSTIENIQIKNCELYSSGNYVRAGLIVGSCENGLIKNVTIESSSVNTTGLMSSSGLCVGGLLSTDIQKLKFKDGHIFTSGDNSYSGLVSGDLITKGLLKETSAVHCSVTTKGKGSTAGIIYGISRNWYYPNDKTELTHFNLFDCSVETFGPDSSAGLICGNSIENIRHIKITQSRVKTNGMNANASLVIGEGMGSCNNITLENNTITTRGANALSGFVVGKNKKTVIFNDIKIENNTLFSKGNAVNYCPPSPPATVFVPVQIPPAPIVLGVDAHSLSFMFSAIAGLGLGLGLMGLTGYFLHKRGFFSNEPEQDVQINTNVLNTLNEQINDHTNNDNVFSPLSQKQESDEKVLMWQLKSVFQTNEDMDLFNHDLRTQHDMNKESNDELDPLMDDPDMNDLYDEAEDAYNRRI